MFPGDRSSGAVERVSLPDGADRARYGRRFEAHPDVAYAEPNWKRVVPTASVAGKTVTDGRLDVSGFAGSGSGDTGTTDTTDPTVSVTAPAKDSTVSVTAIGYAMFGGRTDDKHLLVTPSLKDAYGDRSP